MIATALIVMAAARPAEVPAAALPRCTSSRVCPGVMTGPLNWQRAVKPARVVLGAARPVLAGLHWTRYNASDAVATGIGDGIPASCPPPLSGCVAVGRPVTVTFTRPVKGGAGRWYYSRMHVAGNVANLGIKANWGITARGFWG